MTARQQIRLMVALCWAAIILGEMAIIGVGLHYTAHYL